MGTNAISDISDGTGADASDINQITSALRQDHVPRNASGIATANSGNLGQSSLAWLKAYIASGYWTCGDIKPHHSYNGATPIDQGWFPCDGTIVNQTNYDAIHGAGSWATYVISSPIDGKYSPDMVGKYPVGAASTTQDGSVAITSVGNANNTRNLSHTHPHSHTVNSHTHTDPTGHNHQWHLSNTTNDFSYDASGSQTIISGATPGTGIAYDSAGNPTLNQDLYTTNSSFGTTSAETPGTDVSGVSGLSTTESIQPESIEATFYIRII